MSIKNIAEILSLILVELSTMNPRKRELNNFYEKILPLLQEISPDKANPTKILKEVGSEGKPLTIMGKLNLVNWLFESTHEKERWFGVFGSYADSLRNKMDDEKSQKALESVRESESSSAREKPVVLKESPFQPVQPPESGNSDLAEDSQARTSHIAEVEDGKIAKESPEPKVKSRNVFSKPSGDPGDSSSSSSSSGDDSDNDQKSLTGRPQANTRKTGVLGGVKKNLSLPKVARKTVPTYREDKETFLSIYTSFMTQIEG